MPPPKKIDHRKRAAAYEELAALAQAFNGRLRTIAHIHPPFESVFDQEFRFTDAETSGRWRSNGDSFLIEIDSQAGFIVSLGSEDSILGANVSAGSIGNTPVFTGGDDVDIGVLYDGPIQADVRELDLVAGESLLIARNRFILCITPQGLEFDYMRYQRLRSLVDHLHLANGRQDSPDKDLSELPSELDPLIPLIRDWGISDDAERAHRIKEASLDDLEQLSEGPRPFWSIINAYLDSSILGRQPEAATILDSFAQAAMEAGSELAEREKQGRDAPNRR